MQSFAGAYNVSNVGHDDSDVRDKTLRIVGINVNIHSAESFVPINGLIVLLNSNKFDVIKNHLFLQLLPGTRSAQPLQKIPRRVTQLIVRLFGIAEGDISVGSNQPS